VGIPEGILPAALEGLRRAEGRLESAARRIAVSADLERAAADRVDLSEEFVALIQARNAFVANLRAVQAGDELARHTIDLLA
jgi:flagellar hook-associated protein FlgK